MIQPIRKERTLTRGCTDSTITASDAAAEAAACDANYSKLFRFHNELKNHRGMIQFASLTTYFQRNGDEQHQVAAVHFKEEKYLFYV